MDRRVIITRRLIYRTTCLGAAATFLVLILLLVSDPQQKGVLPGVVLADQPTTTVTAIPVRTATAVPMPTREHNFGVWSYRAVLAPQPYVEVSYDASSVASLQAYAAANRSLAAQLAQQNDRVDIEVTFKAPMPPDQYRTWVAAKNLNVGTTAVRFLDTNGLRAGIAVPPNGNDPLPSGTLINPHISVLEGVMSVAGTIAPGDLLAVANDQSVFLADCTKTIVRQDLIQGGVPGAEEADIRVRSPFWDMEDLGLDQFR